MKKKIDWNEIAQHLESGEGGEVDKQALEDSQVIWRKSSELGKMIYDGSDVPDIDAGMAKMYARINSGNTETSQPKVLPLYQRGVFRYAAAAAVILMLGYVAIKNLPFSTNSLEANQEIYANSTENEQSIKLVDGTQVELAAGSELTYPKSFDGQTRTVKLKGAAFFDVQRNEKKPFIISTSSANVQVLGTSFKLDAQKAKVDLDVKTGKVAFSNQTQDKLLYVTANQRAAYDVMVNKLTKYISEQSYIEWSDDRIRLAGCPLTEIAQVLEFRDGVTFSFENDDLKNTPFGGSIKPEDDTTEVLAKLFKTHQELGYKKTGKKVYIYNRKDAQG